MAKKRDMLAPQGEQEYPNYNLHDLRHDADGAEHLDPTPMQPPLGYKKIPSLRDQIRQMVMEHHKQLEDNDPESIEEADDFEMEEDYDPHSRWENDFEPSIKELKKLYAERLAAEAAAASPPPTNTTGSGTPLASAPGADPSP